MAVVSGEAVRRGGSVMGLGQTGKARALRLMAVLDLIGLRRAYDMQEAASHTSLPTCR